MNAAAKGGKWEPAAETLSVLCEGSLYAISVSLSQRRTFKDPEDNASQLNRLGVAYFHLCLLPISTTSYIGFAFPLLKIRRFLKSEKRRREASA